MHPYSPIAASRRSSWRAVLPASMLCFALTMGVATAQSADSGEILVTEVKGEVRVTMRGELRAVKPGTLIEVPATVSTGQAGSLQLRQGRTTVSVAPDSRLELPAGPARGDPIDRLVQPRGNAFYDVGKRGSNKLRVETPYLVAVIKGTQFNVAVQEESATVSLFEGRLEVHASDASNVVDLNAGEIAIRHSGDRSIRVIRMDTGETVTRAGDRSGPVGYDPSDPKVGGRVPAIGVGGDLVTDRPRLGNGGTILGTGLDVTAQQAVGVDGAKLDVASQIGLQSADKDSIAVGAAVDAGLALGGGTIDAAVTADAALGGVGADVGATASVDLGAGSVNLDTAASVDIGGATTDLGVDAAVDLGSGAVDVSADAGVDLGGASADLGVDAAVDLGSGTIDLGTGAIDPGLSTDPGAPAGGGSSDGGLLGGLLGGLGGGL